MKKIYFIALSVLICTFVVCGMLAAADWYREDRTTNTISVGNLSAEIVDIYEQDTVVMPGDAVDKVVSVRNDGDSDEIVRVRITGVWTDSGELIEHRHLACEINDDDWLFDEGTGFYYYTSVLSPGEVSNPLLRSFSIDGPNVNNYFSMRPGTITIAMEAVQAAAGGVSLWEKTNEDLMIEYDERPENGEDNESGVEFRGDREGFDFGENSDLFSSFKNLLPGQTVIQSINVGNTQSEGTEIFLKAECGDKEKDELLWRLLSGYTDIEVKADGRTVYSGPLWRSEEDETEKADLRALSPETGSGADNTSKPPEELYGNGISLGTVAADAGTQITVELRLSPEAGNEFQDLSGDVDWIFYARGGEREPVPQTGDNDVSSFLVCMIVSGIACLALVLIHTFASGRNRKNGGGTNAGRNRSGYGNIPVVIAVTLTAVIAAALTTAGTLAFMTDTETAENEIKAGTLQIDLTEPEYTPGKVLEPNAAVHKDPTVTNEGTVPMLAFIRVCIPMKKVATVDNVTKVIIPAREQELFSFEADGNWILLENREVSADNGAKYSCYVYGYLAKALDPGESSMPLFEEVRFVNLLEGELEYASELDIPISAFGLQEKHFYEGESMENRLLNSYANYVKEAWK